MCQKVFVMISSEGSFVIIFVAFHSDCCNGCDSWTRGHWSLRILPNRTGLPVRVVYSQGKLPLRPDPEI